MKGPSLTLRVLAKVVHRPGQLDVPALARRVLPWTPRPYRSWAELAERGMHYGRAEKRVQNAIWELARRGDVRPAKLVHLEPFSREALLRHGMLAIREPHLVERGGQLVGRREGAPVGTHAEHILRVLLEGGPLPVGTLRAASGGLRASGAEKTAWRDAYAGLVRSGTILPPALRWPTKAGVERVQHARLAGVLAAPPARLVVVPALPSAAGTVALAS